MTGAQPGGGGGGGGEGGREEMYSIYGSVAILPTSL